MERGFIGKKHVKVIALLSVFLLIISVYSYQLDNFVVYRALRGVICFVFLALLILFQKRKINWIIVGFLFSYGTSSIACIWYENAISATIAMGLNVIAFMILIGALSPKINFRKMNLLFGVFSMILVAVNAYLLYAFVEMIRDFALGDFHYFLMLIGSMSLMVAGFFSLLYNHAFSSKASLIFTLFIFVLVFAEVFRAIAYYDFAYGEISVYIARGLLLLGCSLLVHYELVDKRPSEILGRK